MLLFVHRSKNCKLFNPEGRMRVWSGILICFVVLLAASCSPTDPDAPRKYAQEARDLKTADSLRIQATRDYAGGMYLPAAEALQVAISLTQDITSAKDHPKLHKIKSSIHYLYAITMMDLYLNADKKSLEIYDKNGKVIGLLASPEIALKHINIAIGLYSANPSYFTGKGYIYLKSGDAAEAIKWFNTAIGRNNRDPVFFALRGLGYFELAKNAPTMADRGPLMRKALEDCTQAKEISVALSIRCQLAYEVYVRLYLLQGDKSSAEAVIKEMQQKNYDTTTVTKLYYNSK